MKVMYKGMIVDAIFGTEYIKVLSCSEPQKEAYIEEELERIASNADITDDEARKLTHTPINVGSREFPKVIKAILTSFNGKVFPLKDEIICFIALDDRYPNPILWKAKVKK